MTNDSIRTTYLFMFCIISLVLTSCAANQRPDRDITSGGEVVTEEATEKVIDAENTEPDKEEITIPLTIPFFSPYALKTPVALVNDEPVMLEDLKDEMISLHQDIGQESMENLKKKGSLEEYLISLLDRIIASRLIFEEARNIGLDELPEIQEAVKKYTEKQLVHLLFKEHLKEVELEVPEDEVNRLYRDVIREYNISSLSFKNEEDAKQASNELDSGADFDALAVRLIEKGVAKGTEKGDNYVKARNLLPHILDIARNMEVGQVSPVVEAGGESFSIFKIEGVRYPEDRDALEQVRQQAMDTARKDILQTYTKSLVEKNATINKKLLESVDFDVLKTDPEALDDDKRTVATVEGGDPFTVSELAASIKKEHFHGVESVTKSLNMVKLMVLDGLLQKEVLEAEARNRDLDKSDEFKDKIKNYENSLLFGSFVDKVAATDVKLTREEVEAYYKEHMDEFMTPAMIRIDSSLVFKSREHAENAVGKLEEGTDFKLLLEHAEGQVDKDSDDLINLGGRFLTLSSLPNDMRNAVARAKKGQARVYESHEGDFYVLNILDLLPSQPESFDNVKETIAKRLYSEKLTAAVNAYVDKLKEFYDVEIFINTAK